MRVTCVTALSPHWRPLAGDMAQKVSLAEECERHGSEVCLLLLLDTHGGSIIQVTSLEPPVGEGQSAAAGRSAGLAAGGCRALGAVTAD